MKRRVFRRFRRFRSGRDARATQRALRQLDPVSLPLRPEDCTGPHTCPGLTLPVSWCRSSCTQCTGSQVRPCYAPRDAAGQLLTLPRFGPRVGRP